MNLRRTLLTAVVLMPAVFPLGGCQQISKEQIIAIQAACATVCGFVITGLTVAEAVPAFEPWAPEVMTIAKTICAIVTSRKGSFPAGEIREFTTTTTVEGKTLHLTVKGHF